MSVQGWHEPAIQKSELEYFSQALQPSFRQICLLPTFPSVRRSCDVSRVCFSAMGLLQVATETFSRVDVRAEITPRAREDLIACPAAHD